jgi:hypothetical protein
MKKFVSILFIGLYLFANFGGVVLAKDINPGGGNDGGGSGPIECPQGYDVDVETGTCVEAEQPAAYAEQDCELDGKVWVDGGCEEWETYCEGQKPKLKYDPGIKNCYNPEVQQGTILPDAQYTEGECELLFNYGSTHLNELKEIVKKGEKKPITFGQDEGKNDEEKLNKPIVSPLDILGCAIKTGRVSLWMIPFYIKYLIQFALSIAGLVAIGSIIIGGYFYLFSGLMDDKDKGKRAIIYGIVGFVVAILSWTIVNIVISVLTT